MIIAVNTRLLLPGKIEGIGRFALETLKIITRDHPEHRFVFIFDRKYSEEFIFSGNITPVVCFPPARHPVLWYLFFEYGVPRVLKKYKPDLFFSPDGWLSLKTSVKSLPVIHDLNFFHFPQFIPNHVRKYYNWFFPQFVKKACRISTVSEFTRNDIAGTFNYDRSKIDIVYNGAGGFYPANVENLKKTRIRFARGSAYFVFVGLIHPRKNLNTLFTAYEGFRNEVNCNIKLLVVGSRKWWTSEMQKGLETNTWRDDIIFTGRVDDKTLNDIMSAALALVYISWFEGFGIPVLEAMYCNTPVICSSTTSLPEVGGNAALYADPGDADSVKAAMIKLYKDPFLRNELIEKAKIQREKFSWQKTAGLLWESIEKCIE
jgi:glycosyltransferase involved in cell wall biosynthesis